MSKEVVPAVEREPRRDLEKPEQSKQKAAKRKIRMAAVINWRDHGQWLWAYLDRERGDGELIFASPEPKPVPARGLPPYIHEFLHFARRRPNVDRFDVVFAWELRSAVAVALWRRLTRQRRSKFVIVAPIIKGRMLRVLAILRLLFRDVDRFVCFNRAEADTYPALLRLPRERFIFHPLAIWEDKLEAEQARDGGYVLALGHSNRDYLTLLRAVEGTGIPVTIVSAGPHWLQGQEPPPNATLLYNTPFHETNRLIAGASFHVIPLTDAQYSSGQTVLLRAMACGKAVVVTRSGGVEDYVSDRESALLVPPGDADALRDAIVRLWTDAAERDRLGQRGLELVRRDYSLARLTGSLTDLAEDLLADDATPLKVRETVEPADGRYR